MTGDRSVERLREALRIPTISRLDESLVEWDEFDRFIHTLQQLYPLVHASLEREFCVHRVQLADQLWTGERGPVLWLADKNHIRAADHRAIDEDADIDAVLLDERRTRVRGA